MCLAAGECVFFFQNFKPFGVSDSLGERIRVFSVGNVELIFKNWFTHFLTFFFSFFSSFFKLNRFSFLFVKDTLVSIECEAVCRPRLPIFLMGK